MGEIIAVANQKGGVGKTTTVVALAAAFVAAGKSALVIDLDPQTSLTASTLGERIATGIERVTTVFDGVCREQRIALRDLQRAGEGFMVLAGDYNLVGAESLLASDPSREYRLARAIQGVIPSFDFVLVDCPPGLGILMLNALVAASSVLVPVAPRFVDSRGLAFLFDTVDRVRDTFNPRLRVLGILPTMVRRRSRHGDEMRDVLEEHFAGLLIEPGIPDTVAFWSTSASLASILLSEPDSHGATAYRAAAAEVMRRAEEANG